MRFTGLSVLIFAVLMIACGPPGGPVDFKAGEHRCDYCMMGIADMRFRAQAITHKGKVHRFDSIECLESWSHEHHEIIHSAWVGDFLQKGAWVNRSEARILHSQKLNSPMGAGLSAYENAAGLAEAQKLYSGKELSAAELRAHIRRWAGETRAAGAEAGRHGH